MSLSSQGIADRWRCKLRSLVLTSRERDVVRLVAEGMSNRGIGETLRISTRTVESHRGRLMLKLSFGSVAELVRYAVRNHMVDP
jgi:DNA-binding NarL/FixJ family response regulator